MLRKFLLFGLVGTVNTAVDWGVFWLIGIVLPGAERIAWFAKAISYGLGIVVSFALNANITFRDEYRFLRETGSRAVGGTFLRFVAVAVLCLLINTTTYELLRGGVYFDLFGLVISTAASYIAGFLLNHRWTFTGHR